MILLGGLHIRRCPLIFLGGPNFFKDCLPSFVILLILFHKCWLLNVFQFLTAPLSPYFMMQFMIAPLHSRALPQTIDAQCAPTSSFPTHNAIHTIKAIQLDSFHHMYYVCNILRIQFQRSLCQFLSLERTFSMVFVKF